MPREVRRIAERYLRDPVDVEIEHKTLTVPTIEQRYLNVSERQKLEALTRMLEIEATEAVLIFAARRSARPSWPRSCRRAATRPRRCTAT